MNIQVLNQEVDKTKYIQLAKEKLAATLQSAVKEMNIEQLNEAKKQMQLLDKSDETESFLNYFSFLLNDAYRIITNKERIKKTKTYDNLKQSEKELKSSITNLNTSYLKLQNLIANLDNRITQKQTKILNHQEKLEELEASIEQNKGVMIGIDAILSDEKTEDAKKQSYKKLKEETEMEHSLLQIEYDFEQIHNDTNLNDRNMYWIEKTDMQTLIRTFKFNLNFYKSELSELQYLIEKHSTESVLETSIKSLEDYQNFHKTRTETKEIENKKINIYNEVIEKQPSPTDLKKSYTQMYIGSPKIKRK
ncbi:MAG: hypothetical protein AB7V77_02320 [Candidatus Woesearchaeota archaeon]